MVYQERVHVTYSDNGAGIATPDRGRLFQKGFGKHTGLGLFLSQEILSITGITIEENGNPGEGARFEIAVPKGVWVQPQPAQRSKRISGLKP